MLFADQAGEVFRVLTEDCDLHTVLRLPRGTFTPYSPGSKTNVVFFTKGFATERTWVYDGRSNVPAITKKDRPLTKEHFSELSAASVQIPMVVRAAVGVTRLRQRWRPFGIDEVRVREYKIDSLRWLRDDSSDDADELPEPEELATDAIAELEGAVEELNGILALLEGDGQANVAAART